VDGGEHEVAGLGCGERRAHGAAQLDEPGDGLIGAARGLQWVKCTFHSLYIQAAV